MLYKIVFLRLIRLSVLFSGLHHSKSWLYLAFLREIRNICFDSLNTWIDDEVLHKRLLTILGIFKNQWFSDK